MQQAAHQATRECCPLHQRQRIPAADVATPACGTAWRPHTHVLLAAVSLQAGRCPRAWRRLPVANCRLWPGRSGRCRHPQGMALRPAEAASCMLIMASSRAGGGVLPGPGVVCGRRAAPCSGGGGNAAARAAAASAAGAAIIAAAAAAAVAAAVAAAATAAIAAATASNLPVGQEGGGGHADQPMRMKSSCCVLLFPQALLRLTASSSLLGLSEHIALLQLAHARHQPKHYLVVPAPQGTELTSLARDVSYSSLLPPHPPAAV